MQEHTLIFKVTLPSHRVFAGLAAFAVLAVGIGTVLAAVDDNPGTSNLLSGGIVVPYDGYLMIDNGPASGDRDVIFELWDDPESPDAATHRIWSESHTAANSNAVAFYNGRFSVGLGTGTQLSTKTINAALLDGEQLYLAIQVADSLGTMVQLSGRQAIEAVPYAAWSASSADFNVAGNLAVAGTATVTGDAMIQSNAYVTGDAGVTGDADVTGDATVAGKVTADFFDGEVYPSYSTWRDPAGFHQSNGGGAAIVNSNEAAYNALMIVGNTAAGGPTRQIKMYDDVQVTGALSAARLDTWPAGSYCILRGYNVGCPAGFSSGWIWVDGEDDNPSTGGQPPVGSSAYGSGGARFEFCCK